MAEYFELLKLRRSVRDYEDKEIPLDIVKEIIRESCLAPSSGNEQPWRFIVVSDRDMIKILSDESKRNLIADLEHNPSSPNRKYEAVLRDESFNVFYNTPCLVLIGGNRSVRTLHVDCALAACYFMFSACQRGLGTCWIGLGRFIRDPDIRNLIGMSNDYQIVAPIILGYPMSVPPQSERMVPHILRIVA